MSRQSNLHNSYGKPLILQSKLAYIQGKLKDAFETLKVAKEYAEERELEVLYKEIDEEEKKLQEMVLALQNQIDQNSSLTEKIKQSQILDYLNYVQKIIA